MRRYCCFLVLSFFVNIANAAIKPAGWFRTDSTQVRIRHFDQSKLDEYKAEKDFKYDNSISYSPSPWQRFWRGFWDLFDRNFSGTSGDIIKYLLIALGCAAVIFAVIKFSGMNAELIFNKKSASAEVPYSETIENIHEISFSEEIDKAVNTQNYRLAVRLLYLNCLKRLSDSGNINWQLNKTNSAYINELKDNQQRQKFSDLTRKFEYAWYGGFPIDHAIFSSINKAFHEFNRGIYQ